MKKITILTLFILGIAAAQFAQASPNTLNSLQLNANGQLPLEVVRMKAKKKNGTRVIISRSGPPPSLMINFPKPKKTRKPIHITRTTIYPGSLRANVIRIARHNGWRHIVWDVPNDFHWVGTTRVSANNLPGIFSKILKNYPLQAVFYRGNRVLVIQPRTLQ